MTASLVQLPGLTNQSFSRYLAGLGLVRVLSAQADPDLEAWWEGSSLMINSVVVDKVSAVAEWLVSDYRPTPVISPWNGGSGFGEKDKASRATIAQLMAVESPRLSDLRLAIPTAEPLVARAADQGWDKARLVSELRNVCPESMIRWLDACIVLRDQAPAFPPLLGTGGNDGRLDFSTNFHQRLVEVLPELGGVVERSRGWASDLLLGVASVPLVRAAVGQFDPGAAGGRNSSPFGAAESQVNPWEFVLLIEGALYFASGLARRQGAELNRAAMPFCVWGSPDGPNPGAEGEDSRGEIWAPVWNSPLQAREIAQVFAESRASWQGQIATQAAQMYAALRSFGVARGIDSFVRYGLHKRNGLAFSAVRLDQVAVRETSDIQLSVRPQRVADAYRQVGARSVAAAHRRFTRQHLTFVADLTPESMREMLAELTSMDLATMRSDRARDDLGWRPPPLAARDHAQFLHDGLRHAAEFRVAAALASGQTVVAGRPTSVRDLLVGVLPRSSRDAFINAEVAGLGIRPLVEVLADLVRWRSHQDSSDGVERGFVPFATSGVVVPWADVHSWAEGALDDREVNRSFLACLALDWAQPPTNLVPAGGPPQLRLPQLELAVLQAFASGRVGSGSWPAARQAREAGSGWVDALASAGIIRHGLERNWPTRLLADTTRTGAPSPVLTEAATQLVRLGWRLAPPVRSGLSRDRLVAALAAPASTQPLRRMGASPSGAQLPSDANDQPHVDSGLEDEGAHA